MGKRKEKTSRWRRLDNTAKIFPVIADESMSQVFRVSVTLKEQVQPEVLQQALEDILPHIRSFRVKLRRGLFWYYFEDNKNIPVVKKETTYPCRYIDPHGNRKFLFRVTYYDRRINLEMFHALTDGLGAVSFLNDLLRRYLQLVHGEDGEWSEEDGRPPIENFPVEDSYLKHYRDVPRQSYSSRPAYRLEGHYLPIGVSQVLHGYANVSQIKEVCHRHGVSVTKYLASVLIWSIWQEYLQGAASGKPVVLNIPINLRAIFGSDTMSNFFGVTMIGYLFQDPDMNFDTLVQKISRQMDRKIDKKKLEESISYNVSMERKWYLRVIPLFLKRLAMSFVFRLKDRAYSMTLSNVGLVRLEEKYARHVEGYHVMIGVSRSQPIKCGVSAFGDQMAITFTSVFADAHLQRRFFEKLRDDGIHVQLEGNDPSAAKKRDAYPRVRRVFVLRKGGEEKATHMVKQAGKTGGKAARGLRDYLSGARDWKEELNRRLHI